MVSPRKLRSLSNSPLVNELDPSISNSNPIAVDYIQAQVLHSLFSNEVRDIFLVKGGKAMNMLGVVKRRTKDIDLSADPRVPMTTISSHMRRAMQTSLNSGMLKQATLREQDTTNGGLSPKWFLNGTLPNGSTIHLKVEVSRRDLLPEEAIERFKYTPESSYGIPSYVARTFSPMAVAASKTAALLDPRRTAPRDLLDLYMLIETKVEAPIELLAMSGKKEITKLYQNIESKFGLMNWDAFKSKVLPYLEDDVSEKFDEVRFNEMKDTVRASVRRWLVDSDKIASEEAVPRDEVKFKFDEFRKRREVSDKTDQIMAEIECSAIIGWNEFIEKASPYLDDEDYRSGLICKDSYLNRLDFILSEIRPAVFIEIENNLRENDLEITFKKRGLTHGR